MRNGIVHHKSDRKLCVIPTADRNTLKESMIFRHSIFAGSMASCHQDVLQHGSSQLQTHSLTTDGKDIQSEPCDVKTTDLHKKGVYSRTPIQTRSAM